MYKLDVIAADIPDVVRFAGGWLFDQAMARWDVTVRVADQRDARALRILGVRTRALHATATAEDHSPHALAVAAELFRRDSAVRQLVLGALDGQLAEVTLWGDTWPTELQLRADNVQHRLGFAARAFKAHALAAAVVAPGHPVNPIETFRVGGLPDPSLRLDGAFEPAREVPPDRPAG